MSWGRSLARSKCNRALACWLFALLALASAPALAGLPAAVSQTPAAGDQANAVISGTFTSNAACGSGTTAAPPAATAGCSTWFMPYGTFNLVIGGTSGPNGSWNATIELDRSFDGGTTWFVAGDPSGANGQAIYNTANIDVSRLAGEPERGVLYRLRCTAYTSGTIVYRLSETGGGPQTWTPNGSP